MNEWLEQAGYLFNKSDSLWCRSEFKGIAYSDGDEFEQRMERILHGVEDKSIFSPELAAACVDWPSHYHLSCIRANILRPFEEGLRGADVLEVGAGCGAITRFLGEAGANVCALEGSPRRARIARMRAVDLPNVTVVAENFETFGVNRKFDVVTFIGVLEYANQFVQGAHPARAMLEKARSMLKPGGMVLVAIENQLGLKYFAGAPEDHVTRRMFGIEERYSPDGVRTYGRAELAEIVRDAGFAHARFYAPFPDYKFPVTIFSEEGMTAQDFDAASVLSGSIFSDRQLTSYLSFDLPRVWDVVVRNKLGMDLANSFLVVASNVAPDQSTVLAWHYSSGRTPKFCKRLCFQRNEAGDIRISAKLLSSASGPSITDEIRIELENDAPYVQGTPLAAELRSLLTTDGWSIEQVAQFIKRYLHTAEALMRREGFEVSMSSAEQMIPGRFLDLIPQNIIRSDAGDSYLIDKEWVYQEEVNVAWLVFRAVSGLLVSLPVAGVSVTEFSNSRLGFMVSLYNALGFGRSEEQILELGRKEAHLQSLVLGRPVAADSWGPHEALSLTGGLKKGPLYGFQEIVEGYASLQREEMARADQFSTLQSELHLTLEINKLLEKRIHELEKTIQESLSFKIMSFLRALKAGILERS
jgi:2-polyprenyl-3-methyl-5-hydroxy-6-metoxy-1,4-benzoquinol methylase